jgi:hypothetical protein
LAAVLSFQISEHSPTYGISFNTGVKAYVKNAAAPIVLAVSAEFHLAS